MPDISEAAWADVDEQVMREATVDGMKALQRQCFDISAKHGFHDTDGQILEPAYVEDGGYSEHNVVVNREYLIRLQDTRRLMLIVSELAEAMEHQRDGNANEFWHCKTCGANWSREDVERMGGVCSNTHVLVPSPLKPDGFAFELADVVIRAFDQAERMEVDLPRAIVEKMDYNKGRPHRHGRAF